MKAISPFVRQLLWNGRRRSESGNHIGSVRSIAQFIGFVAVESSRITRLHGQSNGEAGSIVGEKVKKGGFGLVLSEDSHIIDRSEESTMVATENTMRRGKGRGAVAFQRRNGMDIDPLKMFISGQNESIGRMGFREFGVDQEPAFVKEGMGGSLKRRGLV